MNDLAVVVTGGLVGASGLAALLGGWRWWQVEPDPRFWAVLRFSQGVAAVLVVVAGLGFLTGFESPGDLFVLYALLPVPVSFVAEQLRLASARAVLDERGLEDAAAVGTLPEAEQRSVVLQIVRREIGVMAVSAGTVCFLALRALNEL